MEMGRRGKFQSYCFFTIGLLIWDKTMKLTYIPFQGPPRALGETGISLKHPSPNRTQIPSPSSPN